MRLCYECFLPLVGSTRVDGAALCPSAWGDCSRSGILIEA